MSVKGRNPFLFESGELTLEKRIAAPSRRAVEAAKLFVAATILVGALGGCAARKAPELAAAETETVAIAESLFQ